MDDQGAIEEENRALCSLSNLVMQHARQESKEKVEILVKMNLSHQ